MQKKFLYTVFFISVVILIFSMSAYAEQRTDLPTTLLHKPYYGNSYAVTINKFEVTDVTSLSATQNRIEFDIDYTDNNGSGYLYIEINCYDDRGLLIDTVGFSSWRDYIDVPIGTATIELTMEKPAENHNSYLYRNWVNVYAPDGRILRITDLQVPLYESVGWSRAVTMFAPVDGSFTRTLEISPFEVSEYEAVGWYTFEGALFQIFKDNYYNTLKPAMDYNSVFNNASEILPVLVGTKYEQEVYKIRTEAMDLWRNHCGKPMGLIQYSVSENSIGTPEVTLYFRNLSYKKIVAYKVKFTCYNIFGNVENSYYSSYYDDDADLDIAGSCGATWTLYGADSVNTVKNIRVVEVVYEDGTKWYGQ